jgi:3-carboxy-cis,cis-muconate cycloisomerase
VSDLFWPGDERAGALLSAPALLTAMEAVEAAWLIALVEAGVAPAAARHPVRGLVGPDDVPDLAAGAESGGNPVIGLVALLRSRLGEGEPARWLHRGLTSQDVLDTALMLCVRDVLDRLTVELQAQVKSLVGLAEVHRDSPMIGRTLTQHAVPITFGLKVSAWLTGVLDGAEGVARTRPSLAVQLGGAAGSLAASTELARLRGLPDPGHVSLALLASVAQTLGLAARTPWHTARAPITAIGDALVTCTDAWGHLAADVTTLSRPEIAELAEGSGGGSSTMPHKRNPALSVLIRRAALAGPPLASTLHLASATAVDERPDGAWHLEWAALRDLGRRTVVAASQTTDLLAGLRVDSARMRATLDVAVGVDAEQRSMADLVGAAPSKDYWGATNQIVDGTLARARSYLNEPA